VIGDADPDGEATAEDRLRRNGDSAYLQFGQDLLVQGVEKLVRHAPGVAEADRIQGDGRKQLEPGLPLMRPARWRAWSMLAWMAAPMRATPCSFIDIHRIKGCRERVDRHPALLVSE
jgi:hypothetical protein